MRKVDIEYRILGINRKKTIQVPERWEDLNAKQFSVCASIHIKSISDGEFVSRFFGINQMLVKRFNKFEVYKLLQLANFSVYPTGSTNFFFIKHIPGIFKLVSPQPKLKNISFEHFAIFDTMFFEYANNPTPDNLIQFVALLYTFENEPVTHIDVDRRVRYIRKHVDAATLHAIFLNYVFLRKWLSKTFSFLFDDAQESMKASKRKNQPVQKNKGKNLPDWNGILDGVIGDDVLRWNDYRKTPCLTIFKSVNNKIKAYKTNGK